ncbi:hypothetical protein D6833_09680 [Candidatus Parcubacteria bacterium]|nr:MAG: hypothetical protein D6833_09680 [Candidatus Parcubacteria bacterium]
MLEVYDLTIFRDRRVEDEGYPLRESERFATLEAPVNIPSLYIRSSAFRLRHDFHFGIKMMEDTQRVYLAEGCCPLLGLPCPQGEHEARQCRQRVMGDFDPVARFADWCILECARECARSMRERGLSPS